MGAGRRRGVGLILVVIIIIILLVAVVGVFLFSSVVQGPGGPEGTNAQVTPTVVTTTKLIVAARDIRRGTRLTANDATSIDWPTNIPLPLNAMIAGPDQAGLDELDNAIAKVDILNGQPILSHMILPKPGTLQTTGSDAALLIPAGQVAVAFPLNRLASVAYALRTGDHVDVLMSIRFVDVDKDFQTILPNKVETTNATTGGTGGTDGTSTGITFTTVGREENGPFGTKIVVVPSEPTQRPRQVTQVVITNAIVLRVGDWPLGDLNESIVVTQPPPPEATATPGGSGPAQAGPTPVPIIVPDIITLIMSRQDALVLKYSLEIGADIDFALRSAQDNDVADVATDSVTLQYLMDFYNIFEPPKLPIGHEPRIDNVGQTGEFPSGSGAGTPPTPLPE